jgi:aminopeptidase YwaD
MPELCGAVDPFPFIEDGDFPIPVADVSPQEGPRLLEWLGQEVTIDLDARRWPGRARNVIARRGPDGPRTVVMAHIDSKPSTPGALDNAAGVVVLLQLARLLGDDRPAELVALNGEDYYSAAGEVDYLAGLESSGRSLDDVRLAVNIDAAGHVGDDACWSAYNLEGRALEVVGRVLTRPRLRPGPQWWQSDHAIFAMRGRPAVAFTSDRLPDLLADVVHSPADVPEVVDVVTLVTVAEAIADLVRSIAA